MKKNLIDNNILTAINLSKKYPSILRMGIFGSYARGEQTQDSDVDIIYDYDDNMIDNMAHCLAEVQGSIKKKIDFIAYYLLFDDENEMDEYDKQFRDNVLNDVIWVYEKNQTVS